MHRTAPVAQFREPHGLEWTDDCGVVHLPEKVFLGRKEPVEESLRDPAFGSQCARLGSQAILGEKLRGRFQDLGPPFGIGHAPDFFP